MRDALITIVVNIPIREHTFILKQKYHFIQYAIPAFTGYVIVVFTILYLVALDGAPFAGEGHIHKLLVVEEAREGSLHVGVVGVPSEADFGGLLLGWWL